MRYTVELRPYQSKAVADIRIAWDSNKKNILYVACCRSGKTVVLADIILNNIGGVVAIAHRSELVSQMSLTLARNGVHHRIIGSKTITNSVMKLHLEKTGRNYINARSDVVVASVDTLTRIDGFDPWCAAVTLWICDETHHLVEGNKWGKSVAMFPNARGLGVTATPCRADGKGLGRHASGVFDAMIEAPPMAAIMQMGFLAPYRIYAPKSDIDLTKVNLSANGDFSPEPLRKAVHKSHIIGDVVSFFMKTCPTALAVAFCVDVESASDMAAAFRTAGVAAEVLSAKTNELARIKICRQHQAGLIRVICNVDLFGEGVDIPNLDCVIMARPTMSYGLFVQQFCRPLNPIPGKTAIIIDHVGNILMRHGVPDAPKIWTLDDRPKATKNTDEPLLDLKACPSCTQVYERAIGRTCPHCNETAPILERTSPISVDGDMAELDADTLAKLRGQIEAVLASPRVPYGATALITSGIYAQHRRHIAQLEELKAAMAQWAAGMDNVPKAQRLFFITFGIDVASAQALSRKDAEALTNRIRNI
jgi:DNA repair protein RadD